MYTDKYNYDAMQPIFSIVETKTYGMKKNN